MYFCLFVVLYTDKCLFGDMHKWQRYSGEGFKTCKEHIEAFGAPDICGKSDWFNKCCQTCGQLRDDKKPRERFLSFSLSII